MVGHVYVNDNTAGTNTIGAFDRHADGTLTPEPGSPFAAGGAGTGAGLASQGAIQISPDGRFLIAVDAGSNQISVLRIHLDGSLSLVRHGVVSSGGALPVSVAVHGNLVYVANSGTGGSNYTGFRLGPTAACTRSPARPSRCPPTPRPVTCCSTARAPSWPAPRSAPRVIDSFTVGSGGRLTAAPGSPFPAQGLGPFGSEFRPTNPEPAVRVQRPQHRRRQRHRLGVHATPPTGRCRPIGASPFADQQMAPCWVEITHDGQFLFTVNTASGTISRYSIAPGGALTLLGSTPVAATGGVGAVDARLSPDGRFLYVDESRIGKRRRVRRQRRQPDRTGQLPDLAARRRHARRHRRQLTLARRTGAAVRPAAAPVAAHPSAARRGAARWGQPRWR